MLYTYHIYIYILYTHITYIHIYIYIYIYCTHIHIYIHTYIQRYIHTYIQRYIHTYIYIFILAIISTWLIHEYILHHEICIYIYLYNIIIMGGFYMMNLVATCRSPIPSGTRPYWRSWIPSWWSDSSPMPICWTSGKPEGATLRREMWLGYIHIHIYIFMIIHILQCCLTNSDILSIVETFFRNSNFSPILKVN